MAWRCVKSGRVGFTHSRKPGYSAGMSGKIVSASVQDDPLGDAVATVARIDAVPSILEVCCRITGMGFAAVARVTEDRWIACAVRDEIAFGLGVGGELPVRTTLCDE